MGPEFSNSLARSGFQHRGTWIDADTLVYKLSDKSGYVRLARRDWDRLGSQFENQIAPLRRRTRKISFSLPFLIFLFGMTLAQIIPGGALIILLSIVVGPIAIYLWHSRQVQRISAEIERKMREFPRAEKPANDLSKRPRVLEILALIFVGPHVLISVLGEIGGPDTFRNTPLSGAHVGQTEWFMIAIFILTLAWPKFDPKLLRG